MCFKSAERNFVVSVQTACLGCSAASLRMTISATKLLDRKSFSEFSGPCRLNDTLSFCPHGGANEQVRVLPRMEKAASENSKFFKSTDHYDRMI